MKKSILLLLTIFLTSCMATPAPTPNPAEVVMTMLADKVKAEATQAAVNQVFTATQQIIAVTATQQARIDAMATSGQERMDAEATAEQTRRDAIATDQQGRLDGIATANAQGTQSFIGTSTAGAQTAIWDAITVQAIPTNAAATEFWNGQTMTMAPTSIQYTATAIGNISTVQGNDVQFSNLKVKQQGEKNTIEWVWPIALGGILVCGLFAYAWNSSKHRVITDEDGDVQLVIENKQVIRPQLMAKPLLLLIDNKMPDLATPEEQSQVTKMAQIADIVEAMPASPSTDGMAMLNQFMQPNSDPFEIVEDAEQLPAGMVDGDTLQALNKDWKEAQNGT